MFNIGAGEMILIALVLLIAVGPEQLPGMIRRAGKTIGQVRSMSDGLKRDFMSSMDELERASDPRKWADGPLDESPPAMLGVSDARADFEALKKRGDAEKDEQSDPIGDVVDDQADASSADASSADADSIPGPDSSDEIDSESSSPLTTDSGYDSLIDEAAGERFVDETVDTNDEGQAS